MVRGSQEAEPGRIDYLSDVRFGSYGNSALFWAVSGLAFPDWKAFSDDIGSEKAIVGPIVTAKKPVQALGMLSHSFRGSFFFDSGVTDWKTEKQTKDSRSRSR